MISIINKISAGILIAVLLYTLSMRWRLKYGEKKRYAALFLAIDILAFYGLTFLVARFQLPLWILIPGGLLCLLFAFAFRHHFFPHKLHCQSCHKKLKLTEIIYHDNNLCLACQPENGQEEDQTKDED